MPPTTRLSKSKAALRRLGVPSTHGWLWAQRQPGSFFVPTLDPHRVRAEGLRTAAEMPGKKLDVRASICIYKGLLGVLFTLRK